MAKIQIRKTKNKKQKKKRKNASEWKFKKKVINECDLLCVFNDDFSTFISRTLFELLKLNVWRLLVTYILLEYSLNVM